MDRPAVARHAALLVVVFVATFGLLVGGWAVVGRSGAGGSRPTAPATPPPSLSATASVTPAPTVPPPFGPAASDAPTFVLSGAGEIGDCSGDGSRRTSDLLLGQPGWVFTAGDNVTKDGSHADFASCYGPTWGRLLDRTILPAAGSVEWQMKEAAGYHDYFGRRAAPAGTTWYATTIGTWHVVVLDSACGSVGGCGVDSAQGRWLAADLRDSRQICTLAIWHRPLFSSGSGAGNLDVAPFWELLAQHGAELVVNARDRDYERFGPQSPAGAFEPVRGIREIVVGTGGAELHDFSHGAANAEVRLAGTFGILRLTLHPTGYDWAFIAVDGSTADAGSTGCH